MNRPGMSGDSDVALVHRSRDTGSGSGYWADDVVAAFVFHGVQVAEGGVPALTVVEDLEVLEDRVGRLDPGAPAMASSSSVCIRTQNDAIITLS